MLIKQLPKLLGLTLGLSLCSVVPTEAKPANDEMLISQLRGHVIQDPIEIYKQDWLTFKFEEYAIGRIRGVTGDVAQVQIVSPPHITMTYNVGFTTGERDVYKVTTQLPELWPTLVSGADVILKEVDGEWVIISNDVDRYRSVLFDYSLPRWVSRLDLREVPLVNRTDIDWDRPDTSLPPLEPNPSPPPAPEPVPGMW